MRRQRVFVTTWLVITGYQVGNMTWALITGEWAVALTYGLWAALAAGVPYGTHLAYRAGWLEGRIAMMLSMAEAQKRGMTSGEWLAGEAERDGIPVTRQPVEPDDDG
jgi:hypothetical protein